MKSVEGSSSNIPRLGDERVDAANDRAAAQVEKEQSRQRGKKQHRAILKSLKEGKGGGGGTAVNTKMASPPFRDIVQEDRDARAEAKKAKEKLRSGKRYY